MKFWSGSPVTVYILDGSQSAIEPIELNCFGGNIKYFHMPVSYPERLLFGINQVTTDYSVMLPDDEYHLPTALNKCVLELMADTELAACVGRALGINYWKGKIVAFPAYPEMANYSILNDEPAERVISNFSPYQVASFYAVSRTVALKTAIKCISACDFPPYNIIELQLEIAMKYQGKFKVLPVLMWLRSREAAPVWRDLDSSIEWDLDSYCVEYWWPNHKYKYDHDKFLNIMAKNLSTTTHQQQYVKEIITKAMNAYVKGRKVLLKTKLYRFLRKTMPSPVFEPAKILFKSTKKLSQKFRKHDLKPEFTDSLFDAGISLQDEGVIVDQNELQDIYTNLCDFYKIS